SSSGTNSVEFLLLGNNKVITTKEIKLTKSPGSIGCKPKKLKSVLSNNITTTEPSIKEAIVPSFESFFQYNPNTYGKKVPAALSVNENIKISMILLVPVTATIQPNTPTTNIVIFVTFITSSLLASGLI